MTQWTRVSLSLTLTLTLTLTHTHSHSLTQSLISHFISIHCSWWAPLSSFGKQIGPSFPTVAILLCLLVLTVLSFLSSLLSSCFLRPSILSLPSSSHDHAMLLHMHMHRPSFPTSSILLWLLMLFLPRSVSQHERKAKRKQSNKA